MEFLSQRDNKIDPVNSCLFTSLINQCIANDFKNFPKDPTYSRPSDSLRSFADRNDLDYWVHADAKEAFNEWMANESELTDTFKTGFSKKDLDEILEQEKPKPITISGTFPYKNKTLGHVVTLLSKKDGIYTFIDPWGVWSRSKRNWNPKNTLSYFTEKTFIEIFYKTKDGWVHIID